MWGDLQEEPETGNNLIEMLPDGTIVGDIARDVVPADDNTSITYHLREGMKWSDGHPLTADDFVFMFEDMHMHPEINTWGFRDYWKSIEKVDDYTVRIHFHGPPPGVLPEPAGLPRQRAGVVSSQALPGEMAHQPQSRRQRGRQGRGLRRLAECVRVPLLVASHHRHRQAHHAAVAVQGVHHHSQAVRAQPLLPRGGSGQPAASLYRYGGDRDSAGSGALPREDRSRRGGPRVRQHVDRQLQPVQAERGIGRVHGDGDTGHQRLRVGVRHQRETIPTSRCAKCTRTYASAARCHWPSTATR